MTDPRLPVVLLWHMHQPPYRDALSGRYVLPWTYLHAIKDYTDMAAHLEEVPGAKAVVNFTPVLIGQIEDLTAAVRNCLARGDALPDALLATLSLAALYALSLDPKMDQRKTAVLFGTAAGLALMTKGIAGLLPIFALGIYWLWQRPRFANVLLTGGIALAVAAPWHLYQLAVHSRWFLAEYVGVEILRYAMGTPPQTSSDSTAAFYFVRFFKLDPVLATLGAGSLAWAVWKRQLAPVVCLAHCLSFDSGVWAEQVSPLLAAGWRVLSLDMRGHGGSQAGPEDCTMSMLAPGTV